MEPLNPFVAFPKTGFTIFWLKALQEQPVKIDQNSQNPTICKQVRFSNFKIQMSFYWISMSKKWSNMMIIVDVLDLNFVTHFWLPDDFPHISVSN